MRHVFLDRAFASLCSTPKIICCRGVTENTAIVIACILQRAQNINSAGGYLRALTEKARAGEFSVGPMLKTALKPNGSNIHLVTAK
jgi:hypothetical protein